MRKSPNKTARPVQRKVGGTQASRSGDGTFKSVRPERDPESYGFMEQDGRCYILVPEEDYESLVLADMVTSAIAKLNDPNTEYVDAGDFGLQLAGEEIARARKAAGLTQKDLGNRLGIPQSQISRIERNPDRSTLRTLKRIAKALRVDVRSLISLAQ